EAGIVLVALRQGWLREKVRGWAWLVRNRAWLAAHRRETQALRRVDDRELARFLTPVFDPRMLELPAGVAALNGLVSAWWRGVRGAGGGEHDPAQLGLVLAPVLRGDADIVVGSRFASDLGSGYRSSRSRRLGIRLLAAVVSRIVGQRVTDTTSGFQALNREGI